MMHLVEGTGMKRMQRGERTWAYSRGSFRNTSVRGNNNNRPLLPEHRFPGKHDREEFIHPPPTNIPFPQLVVDNLARRLGGLRWSIHDRPD
jgi:hypothetical protein